jgi:hypothetical protein
LNSVSAEVSAISVSLCVPSSLIGGFANSQDPNISKILLVIGAGLEALNYTFGVLLIDLTQQAVDSANLYLKGEHQTSESEKIREEMEKMFRQLECQARVDALAHFVSGTCLMICGLSLITSNGSDDTTTIIFSLIGLLGAATLSAFIISRIRKQQNTIDTYEGELKRTVFVSPDFNRV